MSDFIRTMNTADRIAVLWKCAKITTLELEEHFTSLGFWNVEVDFQTDHVKATLHGIAWTFGDV